MERPYQQRSGVYDADNHLVDWVTKDQALSNYITGVGAMIEDINKAINNWASCELTGKNKKLNKLKEKDDYEEFKSHTLENICAVKEAFERVKDNVVPSKFDRITRLRSDWFRLTSSKTGIALILDFFAKDDLVDSLLAACDRI